MLLISITFLWKTVLKRFSFFSCSLPNLPRKLHLRFKNRVKLLEKQKHLRLCLQWVFSVFTCCSWAKCSRSEIQNMYVRVEWLFKCGELVRNHLVLKCCDFLNDKYVYICYWISESLNCCRKQSQIHIFHGDGMWPFCTS